MIHDLPQATGTEPVGSGWCGASLHDSTSVQHSEETSTGQVVNVLSTSSFLAHVHLQYPNTQHSLPAELSSIPCRLKPHILDPSNPLRPPPPRNCMIQAQTSSPRPRTPKLPCLAGAALFGCHPRAQLPPVRPVAPNMTGAHGTSESQQNL